MDKELLDWFSGKLDEWAVDTDPFSAWLKENGPSRTETAQHQPPATDSNVNETTTNDG